MKEENAIKSCAGIKLSPKSEGIATVHVLEANQKQNLSWDRYMRLKAAAEAVSKSESKNVLDAGGYDGALALFIPHLHIDLIDSATTGGSVLQILAAKYSYDAVVAVDVLEHIQPVDRALALSEFARVAKTDLILNYPCSESNEAQKLVAQLTGNPLIKEHVDFGLPDSEWVMAELEGLGFSCCLTAHTSVALWIGQYVATQLNPESGADLNRHLIEFFAAEPFSKPLYHLISCRRNRN